MATVSRVFSGAILASSVALTAAYALHHWDIEFPVITTLGNLSSKALYPRDWAISGQEATCLAVHGYKGLSGQDFKEAFGRPGHDTWWGKILDPIYNWICGPYMPIYWIVDQKQVGYEERIDRAELANCVLEQMNQETAENYDIDPGSVIAEDNENIPTSVVEHQLDKNASILYGDPGNSVQELLHQIKGSGKDPFHASGKDTLEQMIKHPINTVRHGGLVGGLIPAYGIAMGWGGSAGDVRAGKMAQAEIKDFEREIVWGNEQEDDEHPFCSDTDLAKRVTEQGELVLQRHAEKRYGIMGCVRYDKKHKLWSLFWDKDFGIDRKAEHLKLFVDEATGARQFVNKQGVKLASIKCYQDSPDKYYAKAIQSSQLEKLTERAFTTRNPCKKKR